MRAASFSRALFVFLIAVIGAVVTLPYAPHLSRSEVVVGAGIVAALVSLCHFVAESPNAWTGLSAVLDGFMLRSARDNGQLVDEPVAAHSPT